MTPINVLIMIHGMSPETEVRSPFVSEGKFWGYDEFFAALADREPSLKTLFPQKFQGLDGQPRHFIGVEWGHEIPRSPQPTVDNLREDQRLRRAQNFVNQRVAYDNQVKDPDPNNVTLRLFGGTGIDFPNLLVVRNLVVGLRESIVTCGLGDVVYYCSAEGEAAVRRTVYHQVLQQLDPLQSEPEVRVHLIGQSLGVTLCHDFLHGLFNADSGYTPGFYAQGEPDDVDRFKFWRHKAQNNELKLGSFTSTASQLPLFMMRKQKIVDLLAKQQPIDARDMGIIDSDKIQWQIFYDIDDLLGFGTRRLYNCPSAIKEFQVDTGDNPGDAHTGYWQNTTVIRETAGLIARNAQ
jgi:hypothetical protein